MLYLKCHLIQNTLQDYSGRNTSNYSRLLDIFKNQPLAYNS